MSYTDTTLVYDSASGYAGVHCKQKYDALATALGAHASWSLVDTVDAIVSTNTLRSFVWKCSAAGSGLPADFFVVFTTSFVTATGVWANTSTFGGLQICLGESYNTTTKVFSKYAAQTSTTAVTLNSDLTMPGTWTLTAARTNTAGTAVLYGNTDPAGIYTSERFLITVMSSYFVFATNPSNEILYIGAFDSVMNSTDDPMPIVIAATSSAASGSWNNSSASLQSAATTRMPKLTPGGSYSNLFQFSYGAYHGSANSMATGGMLSAGTAAGGSIGDPTNLNWSMYLGGILAAPIGLATSGTNGTGVSRGGYRGTLKGMSNVYMGAHAFGDTFTIAGSTYVGRGVTGSTVVMPAS